MALLGPVGSGKTALVYAAAQELGFGVLEVNPSMERTAGQVRIGQVTLSVCCQLGTPRSVQPSR
jgi:Ni2+-binding GTPase involved in maturation of urease and hydrogenase